MKFLFLFLSIIFASIGSFSYAKNVHGYGTSTVSASDACDVARQEATFESELKCGDVPSHCCDPSNKERYESRSIVDKDGKVTFECEGYSFFECVREPEENPYKVKPW